MNTKFLAAMLLCAFSISAFANALTDSVNENAIPELENSWAAVEIGWEYTPSISYSLTGVSTKFSYVGYGDNRTVIVEIYDGAPSNGGRLLRSAGFAPTSGTFSGASFSSIDLVAGHTYFIGFRNVASLGANITAAPWATALCPLYYSFGDDSYSFTGSDGGDICYPILEFYGRARRHNGTHH